MNRDWTFWVALTGAGIGLAIALIGWWMGGSLVIR